MLAWKEEERVEKRGRRRKSREAREKLEDEQMEKRSGGLR